MVTISSRSGCRWSGKLPLWLSYAISKYTIHNYCLFSLSATMGNHSVVKTTNLFLLCRPTDFIKAMAHISGLYHLWESALYQRKFICEPDPSVNLSSMIDPGIASHFHRLYVLNNELSCTLLSLVTPFRKIKKGSGNKAIQYLVPRRLDCRMCTNQNVEFSYVMLITTKSTLCTSLCHLTKL